jgi:hypothetical protein
MKFMLLIHHGSTPTPRPSEPRPPEEWERLSEDDRQAVSAAHRWMDETPGTIPGLDLQPSDMATTVRVENGETVATSGPVADVTAASGGYLMVEADDLDAAIQLAARLPAASMGGAIEVRPVVER